MHEPSSLPARAGPHKSKVCTYRSSAHVVVGLDIAVAGMDGGAPRRRFTGGGDRKLLQGAGAHARQVGSNNQQNKAATVYGSGWWARDLAGAQIPCTFASSSMAPLNRPVLWPGHRMGRSHLLLLLGRRTLGLAIANVASDSRISLARLGMPPTR